MIDPTAANPFGFGGADPFGGSTACNLEESSAALGEENKEASDFLEEALQKIQTDKIKDTVVSVANHLVGFVGEIVSTVWDAAKVIVKQAVKMAMFKFAIETCAMGIKSLIEMMLGMNLTPPNIDTKGVFYNLAGASSTAGATTPQTAASAPRYENPFGSYSSPSW